MFVVIVSSPIPDWALKYCYVLVNSVNLHLPMVAT